MLKKNFLLSTVILGFLFLGISGCGVLSHVTSTQQIIQNYENFYTMHNDIKAMAKNVKIAEQKYNKAGEATKAQAEIEYFGIQQNLNNMISEYNAKSRMITRSLWKAQDLPYQITLEEVMQ